MSTGKNSIALLLGKSVPKGKGAEEEAPDSSKGPGGARVYFDEMVSAIRDEDDDAAFEAFEGAVRACKGHEK